MEKAIKAADYGTVAVSLVVKDAKAAIEFYSTPEKKAAPRRKPAKRVFK